MNWKTFFLIFLMFFTLLFFISFFPFSHKTFIFNNKIQDFSLLTNGSNISTFYENIRFQSDNISYKIYDCDKGKSEDMIKSFDILKNLSVLNFYPVESNEEISIFCKETKEEPFKKFLIAGEGGPTKIIISKKFNIIKKGEIHLIKESNCAIPNVALHELFHVLGFNHSLDKTDIMYNITNCNQRINQNLIDYINEIYSFPSLPDLLIENVSSTIGGKFLDINISIYNRGIIPSSESYVSISSNGKELYGFKVDSLCEGCGQTMLISNIFVLKNNLKNITVEIKSNEQELNKENNRINLM